MNLARIILPLASTALLCVACCSSPEVIWKEGETLSDGKAIHTITVRGTRALRGKDWAIWCSQMPIGVKTIKGSDAVYEPVQANLYRITPLPTGTAGDSLVIRYESDPLKRHSWAPEGFSLQKGTAVKKLSCRYEFLPLAPDGDKWMEYNHSLTVSKTSSLDIIPSLKNRSCTARPEGWYKISISDGIPDIEANDADGQFYAEVTLKRIKENLDGKPLPDTTIEDWPDFQYRGFMLDVARNFTTKENLFTLIDLLSSYKINYLHLHLSDDEGWRLAVDGIEELTGIGARHSLWPQEGIQPSYDGNADPHSKALSNGYYTKEDFMDILRYAWQRRIRVIPEFDTPGHSRAAIKAMAARAEKLHDTTFLLQDPDDRSIYCSAQGFTDNVMSVELESVYTFMGNLFDYIIGLYAAADVPLKAIHIGGDEVAKGAWQGRDLHQQYLGRVADIAIEKGVKIAGWQELGECADKDVADKLKKVLFMTNVWNTAWSGGSELPYLLADKGYPVVLSNVDYTYADQAYSSNKEEIAHSWAHYIDDTRALTIPIRGHSNVIGIQGQLFTETIRSFDDVCYDMLPKMLGVFERAWNSSDDVDPSHFYSTVVYGEMPRWERLGLRFHIPQPGLEIENGEVRTYSLLPEATVETTQDGDCIHARARYGKQYSARTTCRKNTKLK